MIRRGKKYVADPAVFNMINGINRDPRWNLVCAIVQAAAHDYMRKAGVLHNDAETFFRSKWFETLCPSLDQDMILAKLEEMWHEKWDKYLGSAKKQRREGTVRSVRKHVSGPVRQVHRVQKGKFKLD